MRVEKGAGQSRERIELEKKANRVGKLRSVARGMQ